MTTSTLYHSRSSAVRAARKACQIALDSKAYQAFEGPDYEIHPQTVDWESRFYFKLRGPAKDAAQS